MTDGNASGRRAGGRQHIPRPSAFRIEEVAGWPSGDPVSAADVARAVVEAALDRRPETPTFPDARPSAVLITLVDGPRGAGSAARSRAVAAPYNESLRRRRRRLFR